jgi:hypothetical protein
MLLSVSCLVSTRQACTAVSSLSSLQTNLVTQSLLHSSTVASGTGSSALHRYCAQQLNDHFYLHATRTFSAGVQR